MSAAQQAHNREIASVRIAVEWKFALQMNQWGYLASQRHLKLREQPLVKLFYAAAILHNLH